MGFDNAYEAITEQHEDHRWAFGTGFVPPLTDVDTAVPSDIDAADLVTYCLMLGDDALVMSHRLQQWLTRAPELEEETALANVALDLLGQTRLLLTRAAAVEGSGRDEDHYAFERSAEQFLNVGLTEPVDADFAALVVRLFVFSTWRLALLDHLRGSRDPVLAAIAAKGVNEVTYHRDYAAGWVLRLGDGTEYSHERAQAGVAAVAATTAELFACHPVEQRLAESGVGVDPVRLRPEFDTVLAQVMTAAGLSWPVPAGGDARPLGRDGVHSDAHGELVDELQSVARALPGATW